LIYLNIDATLLTNTFNNHFINVGKKIKDSIQEDKIIYDKPIKNTEKNNFIREYKIIILLYILY